MAEKKSERVLVWLTPEQAAWLKAKGNASETVRALVNEAMNVDKLAQSVRRGKKSKGSRFEARGKR